ncbi:MAG: hypothetical protein EOM08_14160 [Clostridia bacterium]|nr:hypothetical protein [Clostridia bacterium]
MKKLTALLMIAILVLTLGASVAAATEADIISALRSANVPDVYVSQAQSYLAANEVTAAEADEIIANIDKAKAVAGGETKISNLTTSQINQIGTYVNNAAQVLEMKAVLPKDGTVGIYDDSGKLVFAISKGNAVKQTGYDYSLVLIGLLTVLLAGVTAIASKVRQVRAH